MSVRRNRVVASIVVASLLSPGASLARPLFPPPLLFQVAPARPEIARAQQQISDGDFEEAVKTLEAGLDAPDVTDDQLVELYRLLGLIPDSLDLRALLVDLYTEQVAGFYDPATRTLYGLRGANAAELRLVLAHEMVHALQHQYLPLDSLLKSTGNGDNQGAAQAFLEGHATLASIRVLTPGQDVVGRPEFWQLFRDQIRQQQGSMQVFARTPLALRFELIFPYLYGAEFVRWWDSARWCSRWSRSPRECWRWGFLPIACPATSSRGRWR